jgi:tetratricopeptide (TPR) repeat protein
MESSEAVDAAGPAKVRVKRLCALLMITAFCCLTSYAQTDLNSTAKELFDQERWSQLIALLEKAPRTSADLNYYYGIALAHQQQWQEAGEALLAGQQLAPRDKRFPSELAGVAYKQKKFGEAKHDLYRALLLDPHDAYANEFLATVYFLEGNLEAALKYWNRTGKPQIVEVRTVPTPRVRPALLDHAFALAPASTLTLGELLTSEARLRELGIFPNFKIELAARPDGNFDVLFRAQERNGFGRNKFEALFRTFGGIIFEQVTPEYYNLHGSGTNIISLFRWDQNKRRAFASLSGPFRRNPKWHYLLDTDLRNENWTVQTSFTGPSTVLGGLNLRREGVNAEITRLVGARLSWLTGLEVSHRDFRNVFVGEALTPELLAEGYEIKQKAQLTYELWRSPERRLTVSSSATSQAGRIWSQPGQSFEKLQGALAAHWLPQAQGDDYEMQWRVRAGKTFGQVPFDELFMLGVERDNDLWMRAHIGTRDGKKGSAPLGENYFLSNWETDKNTYSGGYLTVKLGPFLDVGKITNPSSASGLQTLGPQKWLFDSGAQAELKVLGVGVILLYGKDLRTGNNAFYATVGR